MMEMINGYWITQIVNAAATYALADHLAKGPAAAAEIAEMANTDPSATFRLLRACASLGLVTYDGECRFTATSLLNTLRTDNAQSLRDLAMLMAGPGNWLPWGRFVDCVKTGEPQAVAALGKMVFEYIAERPAESQTFTRAMKRAITFVTEEVARILDTRSATVIADIGGAGGSLLHAVLQANPAPSGIVFDLPNIAEIAKGAAAEVGLERRVTSVGGDFFEAVPAADLYLLRYILHDWDDAACIRILQNCRRAMLPGGRVAVIEQVLGDIGQPGPAPLMDLNMMVMLGGRERSETEYGQLFAAAGLRLATTIETNTPMATIIEATAA
ncbi:MAG TPA: methyltransferase [Stellaceae bacterium]|nr:methyltransferase [Stellaceae bacterium]